MFIYLHGFTSSPGSSKAQHFRRYLAERDIDLVIPQLDQGDFEHLTLSGQLRVVEQTVDQTVAGAGASTRPLVLIGSSMGGYLAALYAAAHPVDALVLLAPAVDFAARWRERLGAEEIARWERDGAIEVDHFAQGRKARIGFGLLADAEHQPAWPRVGAPTLVLHGRRDDVVPQDRVERWVAQTPSAHLLLFDAGHQLTECTAELTEEARRFLAAVPAVGAAYPKLTS